MTKIEGHYQRNVKRKNLSLTGKGKRDKRTIDVKLSNDKYTGEVRLLNAGKSEVH